VVGTWETGGHTLWYSLYIRTLWSPSRKFPRRKEELRRSSNQLRNSVVVRGEGGWIYLEGDIQ
jgi:hypothetical protein